MPHSIENWSADDVLALPSGENDSFERKGSRLLDLKLPGVREDDVLNELAKQLSAFSNTGGGQIIYGVANDGTVDGGGVALSVKGRQPTKEWLGDVIPKLTEFEIVGFNVYEIGPKPGTSSIAAGKPYLLSRYLIAIALRISLREIRSTTCAWPVSRVQQPTG